MLRAFVSASPWDLIDDDLDGGLDRLHGEVGVTGVSLWAVAPPRVELRTRSINPRVFHTRGGAFFHPEGRYYDATRCKPIASARVKSSDPIARLSQQLIEDGHMTEAEYKTMDKDVQNEMKAAVKASLEAPDPDPSNVYDHIYANPDGMIPG